MERRKLTKDEIDAALEPLSGWASVDDKIRLKLKFENFAESLDFVNKVGELAEAADHHPDIEFGWGYAAINLTTHDRDGVTDVDIALAKKISELN